METIAEVIEKRWPDDEQLDLIWLNLGQLYDSFHQTDAAVNAYLDALARNTAPHEAELLKRKLRTLTAGGYQLSD